ncbi:MAG: Tim44 domain-containing protein [Limnohabitans sp.]|nr:Tim44 domain-containing protein [Limnohabitans sp.]
MKIAHYFLVLVLAFASIHAEAAKRLGGGGSVGQQSHNVTQRDAGHANKAPTQPNAAPNATPAQPAAPQPAAQSQRRPWGAMLGGLAAGLGLAWLAHSMGFGAEFGQFLMFALIALVIMMVIGYFMRRRQPEQASSPYAFEGAGSPHNPSAPLQYNPKNVGNDASARPWESTNTSFDSSEPPSRVNARIGSSLIGGSQNWFIPADFDVQGFVDNAKKNFITLQDAWDRSDIQSLRSMMTDAMVQEIQIQLNDREKISTGPHKTEVVMLEAQLLGIEDLGAGYMASIEFSGLIREDPSAGPSPFREVWNMTKSKGGTSGWLVAGVQALQ